MFKGSSLQFDVVNTHSRTTSVFVAAECAKSARAACLARHQEKKKQRKTGKVRYEMRKINAEKRPRIKVGDPTVGFAYFCGCVQPSQKAWPAALPCHSCCQLA